MQKVTLHVVCISMFVIRKAQKREKRERERFVRWKEYEWNVNVIYDKYAIGYNKFLSNL